MPLPEHKLVALLRARFGRSGGRNPALVRGIGDDTAILRIPFGHEVLVTTDLSIEGVHFRPDWHSAQAVGHRCLARGLSDIAAMGGSPIAAFLSLGLPRNTPQKWVNDFLAGFARLAAAHHITLAGGDTGESPAGIVADIILLGSAPQSKAILRSGARPGHILYVTGALGGSAAALDALRRSRKFPPAKLRRHLFPQPRIAVGQYLLKHRLASAMIDLSDGLSTDLAHICEESGCGALVIAKQLPVAPDATSQLALHGGEDYELLFTAPPSKRVPKKIAGVAVTAIGEIVRGKRLLIQSHTNAKPAPLPIRGWQHFA